MVWFGCPGSPPSPSSAHVLHINLGDTTQPNLRGDYYCVFLPRLQVCAASPFAPCPPSQRSPPRLDPPPPSPVAFLQPRAKGRFTFPPPSFPSPARRMHLSCRLHQVRPAARAASWSGSPNGGGGGGAGSSSGSGGNQTLQIRACPARGGGGGGDHNRLLLLCTAAAGGLGRRECRRRACDN